MGIDNFHKWIQKTYPNCSDQISVDMYDNVYIDINCILHRIVANSINENMLFNRLYAFIIFLLKKNIPTKRLIFAIDGVAPFAKIILQRKRRLQISRYVDKQTINKQTGVFNIVSSLHFTPGTKFMKSFPEKFNRYIKKIEDLYKIKVEVIYGPGEAEFKLIRKILDIYKININESHILVSTDADIIIMASSIFNVVNNIYINNLKYIISIDKLLQQHQTIVGTSNNSNKDFMLISLFMGNDYLPKLNFINIDNLWTAYKYCLVIDNRGCFIENSLNYDFLLRLFRCVITTLHKRWLSQFHIEDYDTIMYKNYIDGLKWCTHVYINGFCEQTQYMYNHNTSPHPLGLLFYMESNITYLREENSIYTLSKLTIPEEIYAILVLPKSSLHLLDTQYSKKIDDKLNFLYAEETCNECIKYHDELANSDNKITRLLSKQMIKHKQIHKDINATQINYVIECLL